MVFTLLIAFMTAFYMSRLCFMTFFGEPRDQERFDHAHESPNNMTYPLMFLAFLAVTAGWVGLPWLSHGFSTFVYSGEPYHAHANYWLMIISTVVASSGIVFAYFVYYKKSISSDMLAEKFAFLHKLSYNKFYLDEVYGIVLLEPILALGRFMWTFDARVVDGLVNGVAWLTMLWADAKQWFDKWIVDGAVNGSGWIVKKSGNILRYLQTGRVQFYTLFILVGIVISVFFKLDYAPDDAGLPQTSIIVITGIILFWFVGRMINAREKAAQTAKHKE